MEEKQNILVRLPNWLGDTIMSLGFLQMVRDTYPSAHLSLIIKKGLEQIIALIPGIHEIHVFSKEEYKGLKGVWNYGKQLGKNQQIDLFFVLPDSFSSAVMAFASGANKRIGFRKEGRNFLLTNCYKKPFGKHRVEEYAALIQYFNLHAATIQPVIHLPLSKQKTVSEYIVINTNSESITSRLPIEKAVELITIFQSYNLPIKLIGGKKEIDYVTEIYNKLYRKNNVEILAGKTNLQELTTLLQNATLVISSDSGPAHIASAVGVLLVVVTGAGDERNTGPYYNEKAIAVRNGLLPCEPCVKNYCKLGPLPVCLLQLDMQKVRIAAEIVIKEQNRNG